MKRPVSVCIITYQEEHNIRRCLESVRWADEIVVVDSHSQDRTVEICREFTSKIVLRDFLGHIEQKNFALDQASHDWVLCLDADEEVTPELQHSIEAALANPDLRESGFYVSRKTSYLGAWVTYGRWYPGYKLRLFDRRRGRWGGTNPHDRVAVEGPTARLRGELLHRTYRDLADHLRVIDSYTAIAAAKKAATPGRCLVLRGVFHAVVYFADSYVLRRAMWHGSRGLILSLMGAFYVFLKYAKRWELQESRTKAGAL